MAAKKPGEPTRRPDDDRVFVKDGLKHYRRTYSLSEVKWGVVILLGLLIIGVWVEVKGRNPDPELFKTPPSQARRDQMPGAKAERGYVPDNIAPAGWSEDKLSHFTQDNLYVKINGRESFYKSFGFEHLAFLTLVQDEDKSRTIDVEYFDLGSSENALGCFNAESPEGATAENTGSGMVRYDRNAVFVTRGRYYVRAIGSDESPVLKDALKAVVKTLERDVKGSELPWSFALYVDQLGLPAGGVSVIPENAFSFGFAKNVHAAVRKDEVTLFVLPQADVGGSEALVKKFIDGFQNYGEAVDTTFVKDRYLNQLSGARVCGTFVCGVKDAPDLKTAKKALAVLTEAVMAMPPALKTRALASGAKKDPSKKTAAAADEYADPPADSAPDGAEEGAPDPQAVPQAGNKEGAAERLAPSSEPPGTEVDLQADEEMDAEAYDPENL